MNYDQLTVEQLDKLARFVQYNVVKGYNEWTFADGTVYRRVV